MLIQIAEVRDVMGVARYLDEHKVDPAISRAAHTLGIHLATDDPYEAARLIARLGSKHRTSVHPAAHLFFAAAEADAARLDHYRIEDLTRYGMRNLGIADHRALLVVHEDRRHPHWHLLVDRRHPETEVLWRIPGLRRIHYTARLLEREGGLIEVPSRWAKLPDQEWPKSDQTLPLGVRRARFRLLQLANAGRPESEWRGLEPHEEPLLVRARLDLRPYLVGGLPDHWWQFTEEMRDMGYRILPSRRHHGLVLSDLEGTGHVPLGRVSRNATLAMLEEHFGQPYAKYRQEWADRVLDQQEWAALRGKKIVVPQLIVAAGDEQAGGLSGSKPSPTLSATDLGAQTLVTVTPPPAAPAPERVHAVSDARATVIHESGGRDQPVGASVQSDATTAPVSVLPEDVVTRLAHLQARLSDQQVLEDVRSRLSCLIPHREVLRPAMQRHNVAVGEWTNAMQRLFGKEAPTASRRFERAWVRGGDGALETLRATPAQFGTLGPATKGRFGWVDRERAEQLGAKAADAARRMHDTADYCARVVREVRSSAGLSDDTSHGLVLERVVREIQQLEQRRDAALARGVVSERQLKAQVAEVLGDLSPAQRAAVRERYPDLAARAATGVDTGRSGPAPSALSR